MTKKVGVMKELNIRAPYDVRIKNDAIEEYAFRNNQDPIKTKRGILIHLMNTTGVDVKVYEAVKSEGEFYNRIIDSKNDIIDIQVKDLKQKDKALTMKDNVIAMQARDLRKKDSRIEHLESIFEYE